VRWGVVAAATLVSASALADSPGYAPWSGHHHPPPPATAVNRPRPLGPPPRERARQPAEVTLRLRPPLGPLTGGRGTGAGLLGLEIISLARLAPHVGWGVAVGSLWPLSPALDPSSFAWQVGLFGRAFPHDHGVFDPYAEVALGLLEAQGDRASAAPRGPSGRVGVGAAWHAAPSLRLGVYGAAETRFSKPATQATTLPSQSFSRPVTRPVLGLELTGCFGPAF
jgi:hypothetical protein